MLKSLQGYWMQDGRGGGHRSWEKWRSAGLTALTVRAAYQCTGRPERTPPVSGGHQLPRRWQQPRCASDGLRRKQGKAASLQLGLDSQHYEGMECV